MFGLEHIGEVPDIEAMNERTILLLLADVRTAMSSFLARNYFITGSMAKQLRTSQLHGVLPVFMLSMALTGVDIVRIVPHGLAPLSRTDGVPEGKPLRDLKGVTIEFHAPGSTITQRVHYFTVDATDRGLTHYPEFLAFVRNLAPTTTFIKSASYLLHSNKFNEMRSALLDISDYVVQDDSCNCMGAMAARSRPSAAPSRSVSTAPTRRKRLRPCRSPSAINIAISATRAPI